MQPFTDPTTQRRLQRLVADAHPRGPQVFVQLLTNVANRIGGQPAIIAALEELDATSRRSITFAGDWVVRRIPVFRKADGSLSIGTPDVAEVDRDGQIREKPDDNIFIRRLEWHTP